jgi:hypothetical protein
MTVLNNILEAFEYLKNSLVQIKSEILGSLEILSFEIIDDEARKQEIGMYKEAILEINEVINRQETNLANIDEDMRINFPIIIRIAISDAETSLTWLTEQKMREIDLAMSTSFSNHTNNFNQLIMMLEKQDEMMMSLLSRLDQLPIALSNSKTEGSVD